MFLVYVAATVGATPCLETLATVHRKCLDANDVSGECCAVEMPRECPSRGWRRRLHAGVAASKCNRSLPATWTSDSKDSAFVEAAVDAYLGIVHTHDAVIPRAGVDWIAHYGCSHEPSKTKVPCPCAVHTLARDGVRVQACAFTSERRRLTAEPTEDTTTRWVVFGVILGLSIVHHVEWLVTR